MSGAGAPKPPPLPRRAPGVAPPRPPREDGPLLLPHRRAGPPPLPGRLAAWVSEAGDPDPAPRPLASLQARLVAAVLDLALSTAPAAALLVALLLVGPAAAEEISPTQAMVRATREVGRFVGAIGAAVAWMLAVVIVQTVLIGRRGQSVGKIVTGCRIVKLDGSPCGFWAGVVKRWWLLSTVGTILSCVGLGMFVYLADYLAIFLEDRRCLHDHLGGTKVVEA